MPCLFKHCQVTVVTLYFRLQKHTQLMSLHLQVSNTRAGSCEKEREFLSRFYEVFPLITIKYHFASIISLIWCYVFWVKHLKPCKHTHSLQLFRWLQNCAPLTACLRRLFLFVCGWRWGWLTILKSVCAILNL